MGTYKKKTGLGVDAPLGSWLALMVWEEYGLKFCWVYEETG